jgi:hypothetical protein
MIECYRLNIKGPPLSEMIALQAGSRRSRFRFEILDSAASHIEIYFMCQELRMEIVGNKFKALKKKEKGANQGSLLSSVFRILQYSELISNAKHETPVF